MRLFKTHTSDFLITFLHNRINTKRRRFKERNFVRITKFLRNTNLRRNRNDVFYIHIQKNKKCQKNYKIIQANNKQTAEKKTKRNLIKIETSDQQK